MLRRFRRLTGAFAVAALIVGHAAPASADMENIDPHAVPAIFDLFVLRPLGLAVTAVGAIAFVPAALLTAMIRPTDIDKPYEFFVKEAFTFTFLDTLGSHSGGGF